jgi:hypothetical protein
MYSLNGVTPRTYFHVLTHGIYACNYVLTMIPGLLNATLSSWNLNAITSDYKRKTGALTEEEHAKPTDEEMT